MPLKPDHNTRRAAILSARPDVRELFGPASSTAWLGSAVVLLQFGLAAILAREPWWMLAVAAFCVGGFAIHCLNCVIHEASHNLAFESGALNKILAIAANTPSLVPSAMAFRHYHLLHHHHFGVRGMDSDVPADWEIRLVRNSRLRKLAWLLLLPFSYGAVHPCHVRVRVPFDVWLMANVGAVAAAWLAVWWLLGWHAIAYLLLSTYFAVGPHPAGAHILQEHIAFDGGDGMASYYGPINVLSLNLGFHLEHHDMPMIAGWRLPALHRAAPEFYDTHYRHKSRITGLLRFVFDPGIGLNSRPIRELSARQNRPLA
jgi:sphingolipid delta-4 desaturase